MPVQRNIENAGELNFDQFAPMQATLFIKKVDQRISGNGFPQDVFTCEVIAPDIASFGGKEVKMAGRETRFYITYSEAADGVTSASLRALGCTDFNIEQPTPEEIKMGIITVGAPQAFTKSLEKHQFLAQISPQELYKKVGKGKGAPFELDANGNKVVSGYGIAFLGPQDILSPAEPSNHAF